MNVANSAGTLSASATRAPSASHSLWSRVSRVTCHAPEVRHADRARPIAVSHSLMTVHSFLGLSTHAELRAFEAGYVGTKHARFTSFAREPRATFGWLRRVGRGI